MVEITFKDLLNEYENTELSEFNTVGIILGKLVDHRDINTQDQYLSDMYNNYLYTPNKQIKHSIFSRNYIIQIETNIIRMIFHYLKNHNISAGISKMQKLQHYKRLRKQKIDEIYNLVSVDYAQKQIVLETVRSILMN